MPRILLVDDEPINLELLRARLEPAGFELLDARSGEEALAHVESWAPDLLLLDVMMPGIGGLETVRRLKERCAARGEFLPVILVTALSDATARRQGLEMGADEFLSKPFDAIELALRVKNLLALRADRMSLEKRNARLLQLQTFKEEMSALLVHDLKNPIAAVLANLEYANGRMPAALGDTDLAEAFSDARDGCRRTLRLLANLLDVARAEDNQLRVHTAPVQLDAVIAPLVHSRNLHAQSRNLRIDLRLEPTGPIPIDADLVGRIIENVLDNALRYTPRGGTIIVSSRLEAGKLLVRIGNTGRAIPADMRDALFDKYAQVSPATGEHLNSGLGLYFCRLAAEAHGGRIWIEEEEELPTIFVFSLPAPIPEVTLH